MHELHQSSWQSSELTMSQVKTLFLINGGVDTASGLAEKLMVSAPVVSGIIDRLEKRGLVRRQRETADRRVLRINLTAEGRKRIASFHTLADAAVADLFAQLAPEDSEHLLLGLKSLERQLPGGGNGEEHRQEDEDHAGC